MKAICTALLLSSICWAGDSLPVTSMVALKPAPTTHHFFDTKNKLLFTGMALSMAGDGITTRRFIKMGYEEGNPVVRPFAHSTGGTAVYFTGGTLAIIGVSGLAHHTGHHRLERWVPIAYTVVEAIFINWNLHPPVKR